MIIYLIVGLIKKTLFKMINTFLKHMNLLEETFLFICVKVHLSNYVTKTDLKKRDKS